jgi:hypothetical protein
MTALAHRAFFFALSASQTKANVFIYSSLIFIRMGMVQELRKHCVICKSLTLNRVRVSADEKVPMCSTCISELDFAENIQLRGAPA